MVLTLTPRIPTCKSGLYGENIITSHASLKNYEDTDYVAEDREMFISNSYNNQNDIGEVL